MSTFALWLITAALGVWEIVVVREILFRLIARFTAVSGAGYEAFRQANAAGAAGILLVVVLTIIWIAAFIGGAEYHYRHVGQPGSWRLFARTLAVELSILLLALFI